MFDTLFNFNRGRSSDGLAGNLFEALATLNGSQHSFISESLSGALT